MNLGKRLNDLNSRQPYHIQRITILFMCRIVDNLCEIHRSTYSLKEPERQDTVSSPPWASVFVISLLQQVLMAFVTFLIIGNPSTANHTTKEREIAKSKTTAHMIFCNKRGREHPKNTEMGITDSANKAILVWNHNSTHEVFFVDQKPTMWFFLLQQLICSMLLHVPPLGQPCSQ